MVGSDPAPISGSGKQLATGNQFQKEKQDQDQGCRVIQSLLEDGGRGDSLDPLPGAGGFIYFGIVFPYFNQQHLSKILNIFVNLLQRYLITFFNCQARARAFTGRQCPHSGRGEDFLTGQPDFFYGNSCNSGTESRKIDPKVGN